MEKAKDFLYYIGDFIICIIILALIYFLISWKLNDSIYMDIKSETTIKEEQEDKNNEEDETLVLDVGTKNEKADRTNHKENELDLGENTLEDSKKNENKSKKNKNKKEHKITVEMGMTGVDIAYMLEEKGFIDSADLFVAKLETMDVSARLLAGEFTIKENMSYEEIINILIGEN